MYCGSSHVWLYDASDDEFVSDTELNEGMWLSLSEGESDDDDDVDPEPTLTPMAAVIPSKLSKTFHFVAHAEGLVPKITLSELMQLSRDFRDQATNHYALSLTMQLLERAEGKSRRSAKEGIVGSSTKYLQAESDEESSESKPVAVQPGSLNKKVVNSDSDSSDEGSVPQPKYVEVEHLTQQQHDSKQTSRQYRRAGVVGPDIPEVEYVKLAPQQKNPEIRVQQPSFSEPLRLGRGNSPPLPPPPPRGIIKNKLAGGGVKRIRKQRVKWSKSERRNASGGRRTRRADTNVLAVKFNTLTEPSNAHTGDAVVCCNPNCTAILSHLSKLTDHEDPDKDEKYWLCEFCGTQNEVDIVQEEIPTKEDTTFIIAPAPVGQDGGGAGPSGVDDALVIFCIDISGSMCVTTEVPGKFELKGSERVRDLSSLNVHNEDQYMPRQRRDVTYVSRLQSVQAAVDYQLTQLASSSPLQRVALVTFSDEVTVFGDGRSDTLTIAGDKLWSSDAIVKIGGEVPLPASVKDTRKALSKKVFALEESGQTALGPALLLSISMAARVPGSKVIICTDGLANKGVGNLDDLKSAEAQAAAQTFYEDMGTLALDKGVTVSLVRIKGTDCKALELGQVADKTGGQVTTVNPFNVTKEFSTILANPVIATNVRTKIVLHGELYFRSEDSHDSVLTIPVGNVTADTELTYEYGVRTKKGKADAEEESTDSKGASASPKQKRVPALKINEKDHLPFQLQIEYTGQDGSSNMRVITQAKPITKDRDLAERDINMAVVGTHVAHTTAKLAMQGEYTEARVSALSNQRLLQRNSHASSQHRSVYANVMSDIIPLENELCRKQQTERHDYGRNYSDDEDEEEFFYDRQSELAQIKLEPSQQRTASQPSVKAAKASSLVSQRRTASEAMYSAPKKKKAISRRKEVDDDLATYMYNMKSTRSSDYDNL